MKLDKRIRYFFLEFGKVARYVLFPLSILSIIFVLNSLHSEFAFPDSLGETSWSCDVREDFPSVPNGTGMVATAHSTGCSIVIFSSTAFTTYVYVHKLGEKDGANSLVFRYANIDSFAPLRIVWGDSSNLHISISEVGTLTKQLTSMDGVGITYSIGKEMYPLTPEEIAREAKEVRHDEEVSFVWLILWTGVCALSVRSILKRP